MPLTERKGRFVVHTQEAPEAPATAEKRVKRGRFTVSTCLPCVRSIRTSSIDSECTLLREALVTANSEQDDIVLGPFGRANVFSTASSTAQDSAASSTRDSTPCKDQQLCDTSSWGSSSTCSLHTQSSHISSDVPSPAKAQRRVRFSEPDTSTGLLQSMQSVPIPAPAGCNSSVSSKCNNQQRLYGSPAACAAMSSPKPVTRSYCRGRFIVQEAVLVCSTLPRSFSVPEHCTLEDVLVLQHRDPQQLGDRTCPASAAAAATSAGSYWSAASAAVVGETSSLRGTLSDGMHEYVHSAPAHMQEHGPPKRSHSVSYFRRGRFLVQTIYC